jgi:serine/threonine protein kinase
MFIAMEYFPHGDLESHLQDDSGPIALPEDEACKITRQILEGLKFMHLERFTHRDIKPKV